MDLWLVLAFVCGLLVGISGYMAFVKLAEAKALSMYNRQKAYQGVEKKQIVKSDKVALGMEIKDAMEGKGDFIKEKLPKLATALTNHPDASEDLLKMGMKWL